MERRQEVMAALPAHMTAVRLLLAQTRRPESQVGLGPALHPGASSFYDKDKPSFLLAHADYVGLILTVALMFGSWIWQLRLWIERRQKDTADEYSNQSRSRRVGSLASPPQCQLLVTSPVLEQDD